jgi:hypothetical protein
VAAQGLFANQNVGLWALKKANPLGLALIAFKPVRLDHLR